MALILWGLPHGLAVSAAPLVGDCELRAKGVMGWGGSGIGAISARRWFCSQRTGRGEERAGMAYEAMMCVHAGPASDVSPPWKSAGVGFSPSSPCGWRLGAGPTMAQVSS